MSRVLLIESAAPPAAFFAAPPSTAGPPLPPQLRGEIVQLPHPKTGRTQRFLCHGGDLLELQCLTPPSPSSWFVGQSVLSDGALLVASRVDPLFFLLPLLARNGARFSPMSQYLAPGGGDAAPAPLHGARGLHASMACLCDVNDSLGRGDEERLYRLNRARAVRHLAARAARLGAVLQRHADSQQARLRAAMGTFAAASTAIGGAAAAGSASGSGAASASSATAAAAPPPPPPPAGAVSVEQLAGALCIMSEYLADEWVDEVAAACGVPLALVLPHAARAKEAAAQAAAATAAKAAAAARARARADRLAAGGIEEEEEEELDMDAAIEAHLQDSEAAPAASSSSRHNTSSVSTTSGGGGLNTSFGGSSGVSDGAWGAGGSPASGGGPGSSSSSSSRAAQWNAAALDDPAAIVSKYVRPPSGGGGGAGGGPAKPKPPTPAQAAQAKKMGAAAKGTKPLSAFFGAKNK